MKPGDLVRVTARGGIQGDVGLVIERAEGHTVIWTVLIDGGWWHLATHELEVLNEGW